ncbi:MAG TPA: AMP-binding protein, partial [Polyangiaceae bacterium LLY-WYZ-15_(1-7)]|nr:AMP-binding protein [Polyangiaceae bacterium LLY-WYZ-15_(1-7)]
WQRRLQRLSLGARNALEIARFGRLTEPYQAPFHVHHQERTFRLRRYDGQSPVDPIPEPILLVPPLMVASEVYDISAEISAVSVLLRAGVDVWLCDFGAPEREEGGMERTLDDHVRAVSRAVDLVAEATGQNVHLAGYSQGGMFCYQAAAYRRSHGLASVITFGSPVDIHRNLPNVGEGAAEQLIRALESVISKPLEEVEGLPGFLTSTGFKVLSLRKEVGQLVDFVTKLHDRQALEKRESRRRFLGGEGFVAWPGPALRKFIDEFIVHNRMISGGFVIDGRTVTLADITCPVLYFVGQRDDIARPQSVQAVQRAIPDGELFEVGIPAGHFGLVVGSKALAQTWPTVIEWMRWRQGTGERPLRLRDEAQTEPLEDPEVAAFGEIDVDLELFVDAVTDTVGALWNRFGQWVDDAGDAAKSLRFQLPRLGQLERLDAGTRVSVGRTLGERASEGPDRTFFLWRSRAFTFGDADRRVDAIVKGFWRCGVRPGDKVGVLMGARPSLLTAVTALNRLGAVTVLLRPTDSEAHLKEALRLGQAGACVADPEHAEALRRVHAGDVLVLGGGGPERAVGAVDVIDMEAIDPDEVRLPADFEPNPGRAKDLAMILFGAARAGGGLRAIRITNGRWAFSALGAAAACTLTPDDTVYAALPLHQAGGMLVTVGAALVGGARLALADGIQGGGFPPGLADDPAPFWREVRRYGATVVFYAGEMCRSLVNAPFHPADATTPVRLFAGSGMKPAVWQAIEDRFDSGVLEFYASSEANAVLANASGTKVGSVGRPLPGSADMALVAWDFANGALRRDGDGRGRRVEVGRPGVLISRLDETHPGFHGGDGGERVARDVFAEGDRWWISGDVLEVDADGDHWFRGRLSEVLMREGQPVFARDAEVALDAAEGVAIAVVFPREGKLAAVVVPARGATLDAGVLSTALADLPAARHPDEVAVVAAEAIPLTDGYRPLKGELRSRWGVAFQPTFARRGSAWGAA